MLIIKTLAVICAGVASAWFLPRLICSMSAFSYSIVCGHNAPILIIPCLILGVLVAGMLLFWGS